MKIPDEMIDDVVALIHDLAATGMTDALIQEHVEAETDLSLSRGQIYRIRAKANLLKPGGTRKVAGAPPPGEPVIVPEVMLVQPSNPEPIDDAEDVEFRLRDNIRVWDAKSRAGDSIAAGVLIKFIAELAKMKGWHAPDRHVHAHVELPEFVIVPHTPASELNEA